MTKRRDAGRSPPSDTPPDREAVERALETILDRLRPRPPGAPPDKRARSGPAARPGRAGQGKT